MSVATRRMATQEVGVDRFIDRDAQGKPEYQSHASIDARVVRKDEVVTRPDGSRIRTQFTVWVDGGEPYMPLHLDRLTVTTLGEQHTVIVEERYEGRDLKDRVSHLQLRCREE